MLRNLYKLTLIFFLAYVIFSFIEDYSIQSSNNIKAEEIINKEPINNKYDTAIYIPSINLKTVVYKEVNNYKNLNKGLVYYGNINKEDRNIIFGHSGMGYGTYFNRINELKKNDKVYLYHHGKRFVYEYFNMRKISEYDIKILYDIKGRQELCLVTCIKSDKKHRLIVIFKLKNG